MQGQHQCLTGGVLTDTQGPRLGTPGFLGGGLEIITSCPDTLTNIITTVNFYSHPFKSTASKVCPMGGPQQPQKTVGQISVKIGQLGRSNLFEGQGPTMGGRLPPRQ